MGGPLPDRLLGVLEGSAPARQLLAARPEIEAALASGDCAAAIAHLAVRRRALPRDVLARVAEELGSSRAGGGGPEACSVPPAYVELLRAAASATGEKGAV